VSTPRCKGIWFEFCVSFVSIMARRNNEFKFDSRIFVLLFVVILFSFSVYIFHEQLNEVGGVKNEYVAIIIICNSYSVTIMYII